MKKQDSFLLYNGMYEPIKHLDDTSLGQLFRAIYEYQIDNSMPSVEPQVMMAFQFFKNQLDVNSKQYAAKCERNKKSAKMRWDANACERIAPVANDAYTDTDTDTDPDIVPDPDPENDTEKPYRDFVKAFYRHLSDEFSGKQKRTEREIQIGIDSIDKLVRIDGYDLEKEIKPALRWAVKDSFWSGNIRSLAPLRKKAKDGQSKFANMFDKFSANNGNGSVEKTCGTCKKHCRPGTGPECNRGAKNEGCIKHDQL